MKIIIPTSLNEVSIKQWLDLKKILQVENDNEDFIKLALISILCKISIDNVKKLPLKDFEEISLQMLELIKSSEDVEFQKTFKLNDVDYGFIPNLDECTAGEYIDMDTYCNGKDEDIVNAMTVMYRPIIAKVKDNYRIKPYNESEKNHEEMLNAPIGVFLGAMVFFCNLNNELLRCMNSSLYHQATNQISEGTISQKNGDGIKASILLLEGISLNLKELLVYPYTNFFHSLNLKSIYQKKKIDN